MKIIRSIKCSTKFSTNEKKQKLSFILQEYGRVVNIFIDYFWKNSTQSKFELLKLIVDIPKTWLSFRLRKVAAREALDMISSSKERWKNDTEKLVKPVHKGRTMNVSSAIAELQIPWRTVEFDSWLHLASVGDKISINIPIRFHKHYNMFCLKGKRLNSYIITKDYIQFVFEFETGPKKNGKNCIGIDTGINYLASVSTGQQFGSTIKQKIEKIKNSKPGSKGQLRSKRALRQIIDESAKCIMSLEPDLIVVEKLKDLGKNGKLRRRLSKNIRRSIGTWNWKYWLGRLEQQCEWNRVFFRTVSPCYTSQTCSRCGHVDRRNRDGEMFKCQKCGHADNADINASQNILGRFLTGPYGAGYKPLIKSLVKA